MDLINVGQKLSINIVNGDKVIEIIGSIINVLDDRLQIELPPYFMRYVQFLEVGSVITVKIFSKLGTIDFNSVIITSPLDEGEFTIELDYNAVRFTSGEELPVINAVEKLNIKIGDNCYVAKTFEISTEYLRFYCDKQFKLNDSFNCDLVLPNDYDTISFRATVTWVDPDYSNEYTISYSNMNEYSRQMLLYYMYVYTNNSGQE